MTKDTLSQIRERVEKAINAESVADYSVQVSPLLHYHIPDLLAYVEKLREDMSRIVNVLGPEAPSHCDGCQVEMHEALAIARAALRGLEE